MPKYRLDVNVFDQENFSLFVELPVTSKGWDALTPEKQEELLKLIWDRWVQENLKVRYVCIER